jgi:hypothetical protein
VVQNDFAHETITLERRICSAINITKKAGDLPNTLFYKENSKLEHDRLVQEDVLAHRSDSYVDGKFRAEKYFSR